MLDLDTFLIQVSFVYMLNLEKDSFLKVHSILIYFSTKNVNENVKFCYITLLTLTKEKIF